MTGKQWQERLGELVRDYIRSPELEFYFSIKMNKPRAAVMVKQQSLYLNDLYQLQLGLLPFLRPLIY